MEREKGIEPSLPAWKAGVLPLNYSRNFSLPCFLRKILWSAGYPFALRAHGRRLPIVFLIDLSSTKDNIKEVNTAFSRGEKGRPSFPLKIFEEAGTVLFSSKNVRGKRGRYTGFHNVFGKEKASNIRLEETRAVLALSKIDY